MHSSKGCHLVQPQLGEVCFERGGVGYSQAVKLQLAKDQKREAVVGAGVWKGQLRQRAQVPFRQQVRQLVVLFVVVRFWESFRWPVFEVVNDCLSVSILY